MITFSFKKMDYLKMWMFAKSHKPQRKKNLNIDLDIPNIRWTQGAF